MPLFRYFQARTLVSATIAGLLVATTGCGHSRQSVTPTALVTNPSQYDGQDIMVGGTAHGPRQREMRRGTATIYQLCDTNCINVVEFGNSNISDGSQVTVSGRFRAIFGRQQKLTNVVVVGGHMAQPSDAGGGNGSQ